MYVHTYVSVCVYADTYMCVLESLVGMTSYGNIHFGETVPEATLCDSLGFPSAYQEVKHALVLP